MVFGKKESSGMKIAIDGRLWSESGLGRYIRNLVFELSKIDLENEYYILLLKKDFENINLLNPNFHKVGADVKWYGLSEQLKIPKILNNIKPDLVHFPHFNVPLRFNGKYVVTIHDLIHQHYKTREATTHGELIYFFKKIGYKKIFANALRKSNKIITPSNAVKKQITDEWKISPKKIEVTYEAVDESLINLSKQITNSDFQKVSHKWNIQKPYFFYVGNAQPHKNIRSLINIFYQIKEKYPEYSLILSGPENYFWEQIKKETKIKDVIFTGFVNERELVTLYKNAYIFIMPSLEEGFGIPVLEAMACGCPVIASNAGSLPEIGGNSAMYFNPKDENNMFDVIASVLEDKKLRKQLSEKGEKRFKEFSWKQMAKQTLEIYLNS